MVQNIYHSFKLVFLGDECVGKTSIINHFIYKTFQANYQVINYIDLNL